MEKIVFKEEILRLSQAFVPREIAKVEDLHFYVVHYLGEFARHRHPHDEFYLVIDGELEVQIEGKGSHTLYKNEGLLVKGEQYHCMESQTGADVLLITPRDYSVEEGALERKATGPDERCS